MLLRWYTRFNVLSLDVALGAVCSALFFSKLLQVQVLPYGMIALAMSVWVIYTIDHLLDAKKIKGPASTERHRFHQRNFKALTIAVAAVVMITLVVVMFIRPAVLKGGLLLISCCAMYLLVHRFIGFPKELLIAVLYTAGVLLPSLSVTKVTLAHLPFFIVCQFMLTALLNLIIFSWYDRVRDRADGSTSMVLLLGERRSRLIIWSLLVLNLALGALSNQFVPAMLVVAMNLVLMLLFLDRRTFLNDEKFRLIGDAVFYVPVLYLLF